MREREWKEPIVVAMPELAGGSHELVSGHKTETRRCTVRRCRCAATLCFECGWLAVTDARILTYKTGGP